MCCLWGDVRTRNDLSQHIRIHNKIGMLKMNSVPSGFFFLQQLQECMGVRVTGGLCPGLQGGELCHRGHHRGQEGQDEAVVRVRSWLQGSEALMGRTTRYF